MELWTLKKNVIKFSKNFFDLSLKEKYRLILTLPEEVLSNSYSLNNIGFAILQHSNSEIKRAFPVLWERQLSAKARQADLDDPL